VIHVDPWWNPAVEAQATDRAHRIGQANIVTSYKLITRGTVEEKILALQNRKREMTEALLSEAGDAGLAEGEMLKLLE
jgi:SNF2 family DNA or RNA helicase